VIQEVLSISNTMISKSALPDFSLAAKDRAQCVRVSAFDELDGVLDGYVASRREQEMYMFGHQNEGVKLITAFVTVSIQSLREEAHAVFDDEESPTLPRRECNEIGSGRGDESSRFQEQTSAAEAASFA
jgi:hypothetical protein